MTLEELREKQNGLVVQARDCLDQIKDDTPEARAKELEEQYDGFMAEHDKLEERATRQEKLKQAEERMNAGDPRRPAGPDTHHKPGEEREIDPQEVFQRTICHGASTLDAEERKVLASMQANVTPEMRAQAAGVAASGGYTVPEGFQAELVKSMQAYGPMLSPGVTRVLTTSTGNPLPWPTVDDTSNKGALLAENTQATEQDVSFGQKQLDAYTYTSKIVRVSLQLLQDSAFSMDSLLSDVFGERIGRIGNEHLTTGTGTGQPNGIVTASTEGKVSASSSAADFDEVMDLLHSVDPAYRGNPNTRFMFNDNTLKALRKLKDSNGAYIWQPADVRTGEPATILAKPYSINQDMADIGINAKYMLFGDFNKYIVRMVRDFTLLRLVERYADYLQVGFVGFARLDGELIDTAAVKHMAGAAT